MRKTCRNCKHSNYTPENFAEATKACGFCGIYLANWEPKEDVPDINVGDMISRQAAIDALDTIHYTDREDWWAVLSTVEKLPPAQPTQTDCEYCHTDRDGYVLPLEKNCHAYISRGMHGWVIELKAKGWRGEAKIKYCPICGRRLTDGTD